MSENGSGPVAVDQHPAQLPDELPALELADDVDAVLWELVKRDHADKRALRFVCLFAGQDHKRMGRLLVADTRKLGPLERFAFSGNTAVEDGPDFAVIVHRKTWTANTSRAWRDAMLDEQLCRLVESEPNSEGDTHWLVRPAVVACFPENVERYGAWREELEVAHELFRQLPMPVPA